MKKAAPFLILLAGILWGSMGLFVRHLNEAGMASLEIVAIRAIVTLIVMFLILFIFKRDLLRIKWKDIWCFAGTGILSIVFFNYCYFKTITMTSLSVAAILLYTAPAMVMIMSAVLFKEKITGVKVIALVLTFAGCVLVTGVTGDAGVLSLGGCLVGLGAGFGYALYSIFSRYAIERGYDSLTITFYTFLFATIGCLPLVDAGKIGTVSFQSPGMIGFVIAFGAVSTVIPYLTYTKGLKYIENGKASIIASIEPVMATIFGIVIFHESMSFSGAIGVILVIASIIICNINTSPSQTD